MRGIVEMKRRRNRRMERCPARIPSGTDELNARVGDTDHGARSSSYLLIPGISPSPFCEPFRTPRVAVENGCVQ